ncbi:Amastin surface glycofamily protein [Leishmania donovani]|uniref:Amastin surface glycofamily protein n=1 Tax=Leishmania donovani TaxID=5661 RepID=A0A504X1F4_LEIDO|nr:Amastin surface glycofamily protein [Leishmania donovani]
MVFMLGVLVYVALQFIALLCVLIGSFLDMFRFIPFYRQNHLPCLTLWGYKVDCYSTKYVLSSNQRWASCPARRDRFRGSQALVIISICVYGAAVVFGFLMLFRFAFCRWLCLALNILGVCTLGITGALVMVAYYIDEGIDCPELRVDFKYGVGFALLMVAWVLDIFNTPILWLPWPTVNSAENVNHTRQLQRDVLVKGPAELMPPRAADILRRVWSGALTLACGRRMCHIVAVLPPESLAVASTLLPLLNLSTDPSHWSQAAEGRAALRGMALCDPVGCAWLLGHKLLCCASRCWWL